MADTDRIKRNIGKMIDAGAPEADINAYLSSEGFKSAEDFRVGKRAAPQVQAQSNDLANRSAFARGLGFGAADEIGSALRATVGPAIRSGAAMLGVADNPDFQNSPIGRASQADTWGQRYDEELARTRAQAEADKKARPGMTTAGELAGTLASTGALMALPGGQTLLGGGATSLGGAMVRGAASGAALGGAQGFGEGEGGFDQRMKGAQTGALVGGVVGGGLPVVGSAARHAYEKYAPSVFRTAASAADWFAPKAPIQSLSAAAPEGGMLPQEGFSTRAADYLRSTSSGIEESAALRRLALEVDRSGGVGAIRDRITDLGDSAFIADASRGTRRLAELGAMMPGEAGEKYTAAFNTRNAQTGPLFLGAMGDQAKVPSIYDTQKFLQAYKTQTGSEIYDPVLRSGKFNVSPEMEELLKVPTIRKTMDQIIADAEENGVKLGAAEAAHMVKRMLNKNTQAAFQRGKAVNQSFVDEIGNRWEKALWDANPAIKAADEAYAPVASLYNKRTGEGWLKRGQDFMKSGQGEAAVNVSPAALADALPTADPRQLQAFRVGSSNVMRDAATQGPDATRRLAKSIADNQIMQQKLAEIYGPDVADRLIKQSGTVRLFQETRGRVLAGSPTAERLAAAADDAALSIPQGGGSTSPVSLIQAALDAYAKARQPSEAVRSKLADLLANPDPRINAETLSLIEALLKQQGAARPVNAGISGAAGGAFASPR